MPDCDYLISESTYGARIHEIFPDDEKTFWDVVHSTCYDRKGKVIIPAFSVGRTQELVYMLDQMMHTYQFDRLPIYVDSPLSVNVTAIYRNHPECFDDQINAYLKTDPNPFGFNNLVYITDAEESKKLNTDPNPCVIISASGMAEAGRIVHHLDNHIEDPRYHFICWLLRTRNIGCPHSQW